MRFCFIFCLILLLQDNFYGHGASRFVISKSNRHYSMKVEFDPNVPDSVCVYFSFTNKTKDKYQILFPFVLLIGLNSEGYNVALIDELEKPQFIRKRFTIGY